MSSITALPSSVTTTITSATPYSIPNLVNTSTVETRRTIQSIVVHSLEVNETEYRILFGTRQIFQFKLKQNETFTIESLKLTQLGDVAPATTNNDNTKITCSVVSTGRTVGANIVISFANITITG
jgi:hypothetical protein